MDIFGIIALVSILTIAFGVLWAAHEVRLTRLQRRHELQVAALRPFAEPTLQAAMLAILSLPDGLDRAGVESRVGHEGTHVHAWLGTIETWGLMVHRRELPLNLVGELAGAAIMRSWQTLRGYVADVRRDSGGITTHAWFEWLAAQLADRPTAVAASRVGFD
jgi:hypothetical protein